MSVEISGALIILGVLNLLLLCLAFFIRLWMTRMQADVDGAKKAHNGLVTEFHAYQLQCARDFAQKSDISNGRAEMMEAIQTVASKVDRLFDKLDTKADKQ